MMSFEERFDSWNITPEQFEKIKVKDKESINKFYFDNLKHFENLARSYKTQCLKISGTSYEVEDMLQQIYLDLFYIDFSVERIFSYEVINILYYFNYGGYAYITTSNRKLLLSRYRQQPLYVIDAPPQDWNIENSYDFSLVSDDFTPYDELLAKEEEKRQDSIEKDLPAFLESFLTSVQIRNFWNNKGYRPLRRNADKIIKFLRAHGTPEERLRFEVLTPDITRKASEAKLEKMRYEESHLDELSPERRALVLRRIHNRNYRKRAREKARASV